MVGGTGNPFFHRGPVRRREFFSGRAQLVAQSLGLLRNSQNVALVGQRRIGKTSLLFHVADPAVFETAGLVRGEHLFIYVDGTELGDLVAEEILALFLERLAKMLSANDHSLSVRRPTEEGLSYRDFREVILQVTAAGLKPIYLLDEFEAIAGNPHLGPRFFSGLRALASQCDLAFVTASRRPLLQLAFADVNALSSPFFNTFASLHLGLLSEEEARGLVEGLAAGAGLDLASQVTARILDLAGPHPLLLQIAAFHAVELGSDEGLALERDAEWYKRFVTEATSHFEYYWHHLTDEERYTLAALPLTQGDEAHRETIDRLARASLIRASDQGFTYLCPPFEAFVRRQSVPNLLQAGPFLLDLGRQTALYNRAALKLTKTEFKALAHLIQRAGQVVTPEELEKALWEDVYVEDPERVRAVIKSLRKALGDQAACLATKWGVGYIFQIST